MVKLLAMMNVPLDGSLVEGVYTQVVGPDPSSSYPYSRGSSISSDSLGVRVARHSPIHVYGVKLDVIHEPVDDHLRELSRGVLIDPASWLPRGVDKLERTCYDQVAWSLSARLEDNGAELAAQHYRHILTEFSPDDGVLRHNYWMLKRSRRLDAAGTQF